MSKGLPLELQQDIADVASRFSSVESSECAEVGNDGAGGDCTEGFEHPHKIYLESPSLDLGYTYNLSITACDHGWGNTDASWVAALILGEDGCCKANKMISRVNHSEQVYEFCFNNGEDCDLVAAACAGDRIALAIVSAPYDGFACKASSGSIQQGDKLPFVGCESAECAEVGNDGAGGDCTEGFEHPHKIYLVSNPIDPGYEYNVSITACDHGWGNTDASWVAALILGEDGCCKANKMISRVNHSEQAFDFVVSTELLSGANASDRVALAIVSAPYGGFACKASSGSIQQGEPLPPPFVGCESAECAEVGNDGAGGDCTEGFEHPHKITLVSEPVLCWSSKFQVQITACDHGWGNTDASWVAALILGEDGCCKANKMISRVNHSEQVYEMCINDGEDTEFVAAACAGDCIALAIVSAPYDGFACKTTGGSIQPL